MLNVPNDLGIHTYGHVVFSLGLVFDFFYREVLRRRRFNIRIFSANVLVVRRYTSSTEQYPSSTSGSLIYTTVKRSFCGGCVLKPSARAR